MPVGVSAEEEAILEDEDPELLSELQRKERAAEEILCPQPDLQDVLNFYRAQRTFWGPHKAQMNVQRQVRYLEDQTPEKWAQYLEGERRVRTRLSHNEILRVSANQTKSKFKVTQRPAGATSDAVKKAKKQQRWMQEFFRAMEARSALGLRRRFVDSLNGDGIGVYEVYLTGKYEKRVDFTRRQVDEDGEGLTREEKDREYMDRTEGEILQLGECAEIGVRFIDAMAYYFEPNDEEASPASHGVKRSLIAEKKNYRELYAEQMLSKGQNKLEELRLPKAGDLGWPADAPSWGIGGESVDSGVVNDANGDVEYIRYYDAVWLVEIIGGMLVTCERHGLPGVPTFQALCIVTGTSHLSRSVQGITWGMLDLELSANDLLTNWLDTKLTYGRPAPGIMTRPGGTPMTDKRTGEFVTLDISDPTDVKQLGVGQEPFDWYEKFHGRLSESDVATFIGLWERNGLNPITQGQAPGAGTAGYMGNLMMGAAMTPYEGAVEAEEKVMGQVLDFARLMVRDTIKERLYLSVPMEDRKIGGTEWLGLGPKDVDETPCEVKLNLVSDANKLSRQQSLVLGMEKGLIRRERVQTEGWDIEDTEAEDIGILEDTVVGRLGGLLTENAMERVRVPKPQPPQILGPNGEPLPPSGGGGGGAPPAAAEPPAPGPGVGAEAAAASQGFTSKARAGQANGYQPEGQG